MIAVRTRALVLLGVAWKLKWHRWIVYGSPDKYVAQARQLMNEKRWEEAGKVLQRAGTISCPECGAEFRSAGETRLQLTLQAG